MRKLLYISTLLLLAMACKSPEARRPVSRSSGSFIKESAERNKALYKKEENRITQLIANDPDTNYESSPSGFWYYYNTKDSLSAPMPKFGDVVTFTYDIRNLDGATIVSTAENGLQQY